MLQFTDSSRREAQQLADAIVELDAVLAQGAFSGEQAAAASALRARAASTLVELRTAIEGLLAVDAADPFGQDPVAATRRHVLMHNAEVSKVQFELDILPDVRRLAAEQLQLNRAEPNGQSDGSGWLDKAQQLVDDSGRAIGVATRLVAVVHALGMLSGLVPS